MSLKYSLGKKAGTMQKLTGTFKNPRLSVKVVFPSKEQQELLRYFPNNLQQFAVLLKKIVFCSKKMLKLFMCYNNVVSLQKC